MKRSRYLLGAFVFVLAVGGGGVRADHEAADDHTKHPTHTIVLDLRDIRPPTTTMDRGDVLVFENHSLQAIVLTFTDPPDVKDKIRCGLVKPTAASKAEAPWQLFSWSDGKLRAVIPSGRFASMCSLAEGTYAFVTVRQGPRAQSTSGLLPAKGQIVVK